MSEHQQLLNEFAKLQNEFAKLHKTLEEHKLRFEQWLARNNRQHKIGYSVKDAAKMLACSQGHLVRLINRGNIKAVRLSSRRILVSNDEIERVLSGNSHE